MLSAIATLYWYNKLRHFHDFYYWILLYIIGCHYTLLRYIDIAIDAVLAWWPLLSPHTLGYWYNFYAFAIITHYARPLIDYAADADAATVITFDAIFRFHIGIGCR